MKQQPITDESWTEAQAERLMRSLSGTPRQTPRHDGVVGDGSTDRRTVLARAFEDQVVPRLLLARRQRTPASVAAPQRPTAEQVDRLVALALEGSQSDTAAYVTALHDSGVPAESLLLDLLTPTARQLGRMWEDDTCTFSDVTIGLGRLGHVMRLLGGAFGSDYEPKRRGPSALLVQMPGEQHGFGLAMVVHFFRRASWNVRQEPTVTRAALLDIVRREWFGIVGVSVSCSDRLDALAQDIRDIRAQSRNRDIGIMVGGPPFLAHPQLASLIGADATAIDAPQAVHAAQSLISLRAHTR